MFILFAGVEVDQNRVGVNLDQPHLLVVGADHVAGCAVGGEVEELGEERSAEANRMPTPPLINGRDQ